MFIYLLMLKRITDWFVTPKMLEVRYNSNLDINDLYKLFTWFNTINAKHLKKRYTKSSCL